MMLSVACIIGGCGLILLSVRRQQLFMSMSLVGENARNGKCYEKIMGKCKERKECSII